LSVSMVSNVIGKLQTQESPHAKKPASPLRPRSVPTLRVLLRPLPRRASKNQPVLLVLQVRPLGLPPAPG